MRVDWYQVYAACADYAVMRLFHQPIMNTGSASCITYATLESSMHMTMHFRGRVERTAGISSSPGALVATDFGAVSDGKTGDGPALGVATTVLMEHGVFSFNFPVCPEPYPHCYGIGGTVLSSCPRKGKSRGKVGRGCVA